MMWLFMSFSILLSLFFFVVWNPLTLGLILILQTLSLSFLMGYAYLSFWFFYLLVLVFIGGMLVLFIYVTSIFPNEKFSFNQNLSLILFMLMISSIFLFVVINNLFMYSPNMNIMESLLNMKMNFNMISTTKIFNSMNSLLLIFLVSYLFYCMIIVIKMTNFFMGPLRKMTYV